MSSIPLSIQQLEDITTEVARELLESWAINDRFSENQMAEAGKNAVDDTVLIINKFMELFNYHMVFQTEKQNLIQ